MKDAADVRFWVTWAGATLRRPGLTDTAAISDATGLSERTVRHWKQTNRAPAWAVRILMQTVTGIPAYAKNWAGWGFKPGPDGAVLGGPNGQEWTPEDLDRLRDTCARLRSLEASAGPDAQLEWKAPGSGRRTAWPAGETPTWAQLEDALRRVIQDEHHRDRIGP